MKAEVYRYDGAWRISIYCQGYGAWMASEARYPTKRSAMARVRELRLEAKESAAQRARITASYEALPDHEPETVARWADTVG
jgi:hypothetical protein